MEVEQKRNFVNKIAFKVNQYLKLKDKTFLYKKLFEIDQFYLTSVVCYLLGLNVL